MILASHDWATQTAQAGYEGTGYSRALPDVGARYEETETASSPQLSWPIYNETGDTYSVWVRGMAPDAGGDLLHVGLDGGAPSTAADLTGFTNEWSWSRVTPAGNATLDLTATGEHTLNAWMREDGLRVDRVLLVTDTNYIPSGLGPAESPFQTITDTIPGGLGTTSISYGYDPLYRLTDAAYTGAITASFAYDYDPVGNMTAFTETVDAQTTSVTRTFDGANRLEYAVNASGTTTYTYDANGNLVELLPPGATVANPVGGLRYAYNQRNLMVSHETNPDGTAWVLQAEYVYDGSNGRLQQVDYTGATAITTTYTNDIFGLTQMLVADDGTTQVYNLFGLDLISQDSGAEVRTLLVDGLGSVRLEMVGSVVETATTYSPYGEVLEQTGTSGTVYGFTGEQEDSATDLLYLRARYYSPALKVFQSRDPWEGTGWQPGTLNYYTYVHGNPVNRVDPSGLYAFGSSQALLDEANATADDIMTQAVHIRLQARLGVVGSPHLHAEYTIPGTNWPVDLLYSPLGYVWEIKPRDSAADASAIATRNAAALSAAREAELLTGPTPVGGTYNWNHDPKRWIPAPKGTLSSRMELGTDLSGRVNIVAGQTGEGVIIWWKERRRTQEVYDPIRLPDWVIWSEKNWAGSSASIVPVPAPAPSPGPIGTPTPPGHQPVPPPGYSPPVPQPVPTPPGYNPPICTTDYSGFWSSLLSGGGAWLVYRLIRFGISPFCGPAAPVCAFAPG